MVPFPGEVGRESRWARVWVEWGLLVVLAGWFCWTTLPAAFGTLQTDFPNYYVTAKLATEGTDAAHVYEWRWIARQKDHLDVDRALIGLVPITPFSTLAVAPLTWLDALTAKRVWLVLQLLLLWPVARGLRGITGEPLRRIGIVIFASVPMQRNLMYGQFYILLVALLIGACWAQQRGRSGMAGALVGVATAVKIFPFLFLLYFVRKREWRALVCGVGTLLACGAVSLWVFGWELHRTYLLQVLPWTLRGDALPPFALGSGSISTLLHCLFLYEPQWNPHPWHLSVGAFAVLGAVLPMLILAPALLLCDEGNRTRGRVALEWAALTVATLTVSPIPASYNFTLMVLPVVVLVGRLLPKRPAMALAVMAIYAGIGAPSGWHVGAVSGLGVLWQGQRLYLLIVLAMGLYFAMGRVAWSGVRRPLTAVLAGMFVLVAMRQATTMYRQQKDVQAEFAYRLEDKSGALLTAAPAWQEGKVMRVAMQPGGYRLLDDMETAPGNVPWPENSVGPDEIAFAASGDRVLVEMAGAQSVIRSRSGEMFRKIVDAESPVLSADGKTLAFVRRSRGRGQLFVRAVAGDEPKSVTPEWLDVEGASFVPDGSLVVAGLRRGTGGSRLYRVHDGREPELMPLGEARYPAVSPDGRWIAYSRMRNGNWKLALMERTTGVVKNVSDAPCNTMEPSWEPDSKTVLYASDCGRALWFTAISRRRVVE